MEDIKSLIFSTPFQLVLDHLLQNAELELSDSEVTEGIVGARRAAIHQSLLRLNQHGITRRGHQGRRCLNKLNQGLPWIAPLKIVSNILDLDPFISSIKDIATKAVLFGSRASGDNRHDSDYDLLIISTAQEKIIHQSMHDPLSERFQLIVKTPEEFLDIGDREPVLANNIRKGIVLWGN